MYSEICHSAAVPVSKSLWDQLKHVGVCKLMAWKTTNGPTKITQTGYPACALSKKNGHRKKQQQQ